MLWSLCGEPYPDEAAHGVRAHVAGHKHVATTSRYVHANRRAADRVLDAHHRIPVTIPVAGPESGDDEGGESDVSTEDSGVGHPGLEPGANGLRTQLLRIRNRLYLTISQIA
jgi:hypothetical protein